MAEHNRVTRPDALREIVRRLDHLEKQMRMVNARAGRAIQMDRGKSSLMPAPGEGQLLVETEGGGLRFFTNGEWRGGAYYEIKLFADNQMVTAEEGRFKLAIPHDVHYATLTFARIYVTTASSSGIVTVSLWNDTTGHDLLSTPLTIDVGEKNSRTASTPYVISPTYSRVERDDEIWVNVDVGGSGAKGLGISMNYA